MKFLAGESKLIRRAIVAYASFQEARRDEDTAGIVAYGYLLADCKEVFEAVGLADQFETMMRLTNVCKHQLNMKKSA